MKTKKCTKCGEVKPLDEFYGNKQSKDGKAHQCKICINKKQHIYSQRLSGKQCVCCGENLKIKQKKYCGKNCEFLARSTIRVIEGVVLKKCSICGTVKPVEKFYKQVQVRSGQVQVRSGGRSAACRQCEKLKNKAYRNKKNGNFCKVCGIPLKGPQLHVCGKACDGIRQRKQLLYMPNGDPALRCGKCEEIKPLKMYHTDRRRAFRKKSYCMSCQKTHDWTKKKRKNGKYCETCKKELAGFQKKYCSYLCMSKNMEAKPGTRRIEKTGYISVKAPNHPNASKASKGWVLEHLMLKANQIGRRIETENGEKVHHQNRNRQDNSLENLELCDNENTHPPGARVSDLVPYWILKLAKNTTGFPELILPWCRETIKKYGHLYPDE